MSKGRSSLPPTRANSRQNRSNSFPENDNLQPPTKTNRGSRSFDTKASKPEQDSLEDGKILVLKVIGKVNLRIERKEYQELTRILNQIPGDVLVLILDNLSIESLYADIPSSLASLAALYSKIFYDRQGKLPDHGFSSDDFVHRLVRYFVDVLKYNNQTFASARSREHIKTIFKVCAQIDNSLHERIVQRVEQLSKALKGFSENSLLETMTRSSATRYMRMPEALKSELEWAINHYKSSLQRLADVLLSMPDNHGELDLSSSAHNKVDIDEKTIQYMRKLSRKTIEDRLSFNQSLLSAVQESSRDKLLINGLIDSLGTRINHDKEVLQLLSALRKEFNVSLDEQVLPLLERFHHGYRLVLQLLEESLKDVATLKVPTITRTMASDSESGDVSEDGSDVFDTVTQLDDDETEFSALSSSETEQAERVKPTQRKQSSPNVNGKETNQQQKDINADLQKQLQNKQKELEEAQEMVQLLRKREKNLTDRLQDQAQRQLKKGGKFEDLSAGECRPSALVERYDNLYTQTRLDAMDELDELESLDKVDDSGDIKNKILISVLVVAYRTVQHSLTEKQTKLKKILGIPDDDKIAGHAQEMQDRIADYLRITGARLKIDSIKQDVSKQLWSTLYDFPELQNCVKLKEYMDKCVRLSWMLAVQVPPMSIEYEATEFSEKLHGRFMTSDMTSLEIKYHVWPALIDSKAGVVLYRGTVVT